MKVGRISCPILFDGRLANLYSYVGGDSINLKDPSGEIVPLIVAGALFGGGIGLGICFVANGDCATWDGALAAFVGGAIAGGVGVVAAPIAAHFGFGTGVLAIAEVNGVAGLASAVATSAIDSQQSLTAEYALSSMVFGAVGGVFGSKLAPTRGMSNFRQVGFPRTIRGVVPRSLGGSAGPNAIKSIYAGGGVAVGVGTAGSTFVQ